LHPTAADWSLVTVCAVKESARRTWYGSRVHVAVPSGQGWVWVKRGTEDSVPLGLPKGRTIMAEVTKELRVKACNAYVAAKKDGKSNVEAKQVAHKIAKVGHSLLDLSWYATKFQALGTFAQVAEGETAQAIVALRGGAGWNGKHVGQRLAWGPISICLGWFNPSDPSTAGENAVQRLFPICTKVVAGVPVAAEGTRSGKGGRWLADDPQLYVGNHKGHGVEEEKPRFVDRKELRDGADEYQGKVVAFAAGRKAAARRPRKPRTQATKK